MNIKKGRITKEMHQKALDKALSLTKQSKKIRCKVERSIEIAKKPLSEKQRENAHRMLNKYHTIFNQELGAFRGGMLYQDWKMAVNSPKASLFSLNMKVHSLAVDLLVKQQVRDFRKAGHIQKKILQLMADET